MMAQIRVMLTFSLLLWIGLIVILVKAIGPVMNYFKELLTSLEFIIGSLPMKKLVILLKLVLVINNFIN